MGPQPIAQRSPVPPAMTAAAEQVLKLIESGDRAGLEAMAFERARADAGALSTASHPGRMRAMRSSRRPARISTTTSRRRIIGPGAAPILLQIRLGEHEGRWVILEAKNLTGRRSAWTASTRCRFERICRDAEIHCQSTSLPVLRITSWSRSKISRGADRSEAAAVQRDAVRGRLPQRPPARYLRPANFRRWKRPGARCSIFPTRRGSSSSIWRARSGTNRATPKSYEAARVRRLVSGRISRKRSPVVVHAGR